MKRGEDWFIREDWSPYYRWLEDRLFVPGRWAVIPDAPGAPSQLNDNLLPQWPFGCSKGAPLWHMDGPIGRLLKLCDKYDRVCLGWTGHGKHLDNYEYHKRMEDVCKALGNIWPTIHMMRGVKVAYDYPFSSADSTSLAQNGHLHDWKDHQYGPNGLPEKWDGRNQYANNLEAGNPDRRKRSLLGIPPIARWENARTHLGGDGLDQMSMFE